MEPDTNTDVITNSESETPETVEETTETPVEVEPEPEHTPSEEAAPAEVAHETPVAEEVPAAPESHSSVGKEFTTNGIKYRRELNAQGAVVDVRI
jgi:hypothetical protein